MFPLSSWESVVTVAALFLAACHATPSSSNVCHSESPPAGTLLRPDGNWLVPAGTQAAALGEPLSILPLGDGTAIVTNNNFFRGGLSRVTPGKDPVQFAQFATGIGQGLAISSDGKTLFVAGGPEGRIVRMAKNATGEFEESGTFGPTDLAFPIQVALSSTLVAATEEQGARVTILDAVSGALRSHVTVGAHPWGLAFSQNGNTLYATSRADGTVSALDTASGAETLRAHVCNDPVAILPMEAAIAVACVNDDTVLLLDSTHLTVQKTFSFDGVLGYGAMPSALARSGNTLFVALSGEDALAALDVTTFADLGRLPVSWYPAALAVSQGSLWVANARVGLSPNPLGHQIVTEISGSVSVIPLPSTADLQQGAATVAKAQCEDRPAAAAPPAALRALSRIKHVVVLMRENKTFDQEFGDLGPPLGDSSQLLDGDAVTPQSHALARRYSLYGGFHLDNEVSVLGYHWGLGAIAPDFVERTWMYCYGKTRPCDNDASYAELHSGYLPDAAISAGVSAWLFGNIGDRPRWDAISEPGFNESSNQVRDADRAAMVSARLASWTQAGSMPAFVFVHLPDDGAECGNGCVQGSGDAAILDNDAATGAIVASFSASPFWKDMAIYVVEDDPQPGWDHVDSHRSFVISVSPFAKHGCKSATRYSWPSLLHAIEISLGLPSLTRNDARAAPLADCLDDGVFDPTPWKP